MNGSGVCFIFRSLHPYGRSHLVFLNSIENDIFLFVFSRRGLPILVAFDTGKNKTSKIGF